MQFEHSAQAARSRSPHFLSAVQKLSLELALDFDKIAEGYPMRCEGIAFWLQDYGLLDSNALTLMIEIGELANADDAVACRQLLEYNYVMPGGAHGYCALMPGSNVIAYCVRIDFDKFVDPGAEILSIVRTMIERKDEVGALVQTAMAQEVV